LTQQKGGKQTKGGLAVEEEGVGSEFKLWGQVLRAKSRREKSFQASIIL